MALLTPALVAQRDDTGRGKFASATLPESNEALLFSSRVEEAIQVGDYRLAVELIDRLRGLPGGLVAAPASRTYYPVWRQAFRLLAQLPEQGVELYRQLHDAEVSARFEEAVAAADLNALRELFHDYRLGSAWPAIGVELAAHLLDRGAYGEAIEVLREISESGVGVTPEHKAQLAVALASVGAARPAARLLAELRADPDLKAQPEWRERVEQLDRWFTALRSDGPAAVAQPPHVLAPCIEAGAVWTLALLPEVRAQFVDEGHDIAQAIDVFRRLPLQRPVLAEQTLVVRMHGRLWAIDAGTLMLRWRVAERPADRAAAVFPGAVPGAGRKGHPPLSYDTQLLISNHLQHAVAVGFGKVYTVEGLTLLEAEVGALGRRPFAAARGSGHRNELVARELNSGRIVWRTAAEPADPLFDVAFQDAPLVVGEALVAPIKRGDDLSLAVIDPADGRLMREVALVGPPTYFSKEGGRCRIVSDETTLYVCTGNGVIAALARDDLSWKWATVYPSTLAERLGQLWWQPPKNEEEGGVDPPVIADDVLIVAPVDSDPPAIFALDRFSGRERWRISRREYPFLIGAVRGGLVVGGHALTCLDSGDPGGRPPRWKSVPLQITGRAAVREERVYVPTREGIVVLDGRTGKVLADQIEAAASERGAASADRDDPGGPEREARARPAPSATPDRTANLFVSSDALFSVSPCRVVKYPDLRRLRARYDALAEEEAASDRVELIRAWLDALGGRFGDAVARLQARPFGDSQLSVARDRLLTYVFLGLARRAPAGEDRLDWLQRALALADSPQAAARLAITIGRALEEGGRLLDALRHYGEVICQPDACYVADTGDADRHVADWLHAAERIRAIYGEVPAEAAAQMLSRALAGGDRGEDRVTSLQRLRVALANEPLGERVDWLLSLQKLSPELKLQYLPKRDPPGLPAGLHRRLHLERWDTHVSLGLLDEARKDRVAWQARSVDSETHGPTASQPIAFEPLSPQKERERVEAIKLAFRKLEQAGGEPFTWVGAPQWKIERAELLLDPRRPLSGLRPWMLVADLGHGRIELVHAYKHQFPQRQTEDRMMKGWVDSGAAYGLARTDRRSEWDEGRRSVWPVIVYHQLAAVPVRGGLVCVGLGPERYAGRRQWEYAVPEWDDVPAGFAYRSVAGPRGVYFAPDHDRVVLVGWFDGQMWWQRDLPGVTIDRLHLSDEQLVIVSDDRRIWVTDATFGRHLRRVETGTPAPRRIDVVGDTIVVWGPESVRGLASDTLREIWTRPCPPVDDSVTVPARPWLAYRTRGELEWHLLDVRRGEPVFDTSLGVFDGISAIVAGADRLFVAGHADRPGGDEEARVARLIALDPVDGTGHWSRDFATPVAVNPTQLAAHPEYIPVLLAGSAERRDGSGESDLPAIQLINKRDGELGERVSIKEDYRPVVEASCDMYMLATPTRMIVQAGGNLIAYGNSPLRPAP
ncbi:MAG: PQQ-binding-like beta-propeller repeat protein [Phycisphaerae bacterium]